MTWLLAALAPVGGRGPGLPEKNLPPPQPRAAQQPLQHKPSLRIRKMTETLEKVRFSYIFPSPATGHQLRKYTTAISILGHSLPFGIKGFYPMRDFLERGAKNTESCRLQNKLCHRSLWYTMAYKKAKFHKLHEINMG